MSYQLRPRKIAKIVNTKGVADDPPDDTDESEGSEGSEEYSSDEESPQEQVLNIVLRVQRDEDSESDDESVASVDVGCDTKSDEFMQKMAVLGSLVEYKDVPMYQEFMKTHKEALETQSKQKKEKDAQIRCANGKKFNTLLADRPMSDMAYFK
jgi:hypothetical protein